MIQNYAKKLSWRNMPMSRLRFINELWANNDYVIILKLPNVLKTNDANCNLV